MPVPGVTPTTTTPERTIWMPTAAGRTCRTTATCGFRTKRAAGLRIATATGCMSLTTAGRGWATSLGAGRRITTGAGSPMAVLGRGGLGRSMLVDMLADFTVRSGLRLMFRSGDGARALASDLVLVV